MLRKRKKKESPSPSSSKLLKAKALYSAPHFAASNSNKRNRYIFVVHAKIFTNLRSSATTYAT